MCFKVPDWRATHERCHQWQAARRGLKLWLVLYRETWWSEATKNGCGYGGYGGYGGYDGYGGYGPFSESKIWFYNVLYT